jgi:hypothetical protein
MFNPTVSIITPTTGKDGLFKLIESLDKQNVDYIHILLWDSKREGKFLYPDPNTFKVMNPYDLNSHNRYSIVIPGGFVQGVAAGSALRAIGLNAANTNYVTFADDDVWYEDNHLKDLLGAIKDKQWAYCKRKVWANNTDYIGIDDFESVGNSPSKKVPYEMVDNNSMIFTQVYGTNGAVLYRNTKDYNDDRLFYAFLKQHAGEPGITNKATVNQICPKKLEQMFRQYCIKE